eukprot:gene9650-7566_t
MWKAKVNKKEGPASAALGEGPTTTQPTSAGDATPMSPKRPTGTAFASGQLIRPSLSHPRKNARGKPTPLTSTREEQGETLVATPIEIPVALSEWLSEQSGRTGLSVSQLAYTVKKMGVGSESMTTLYIMEPIVSLVDGLLEGEHTVSQGLSKGNFGLGTLDMLDGEVLVYQGIAYHQNASGVTSKLSGDEKSPFMTMTWHYPEQSTLVTTSTIMNLQELHQFVKKKCMRSTNVFYSITIEGSFPRIKTRAVRKQEQSTRLVDVAKNQAIFDAVDERGILVGFWTPEYMGSNISVPGFHLHYLSDDRTRGGHLLNCELTEGALITVQEMVKFLKSGKVVILLAGRYAGKKAVILKQSDDGTSAKPYGHAVVVIKRQSMKKQAKRSSVKTVNYNHMMPTRYTMDVDFKSTIAPECYDNSTKKVEANKATVYDDRHMGNYMAVVVHFSNLKTEHHTGGVIAVVKVVEVGEVAVSGSDPCISIISVAERMVRSEEAGGEDGNLRIWDVPNMLCLASIEANAWTMDLDPACSIITILTSCHTSYPSYSRTWIQRAPTSSLTNVSPPEPGSSDLDPACSNIITSCAKGTVQLWPLIASRTKVGADLVVGPRATVQLWPLTASCIKQHLAPSPALYSIRVAPKPMPGCQSSKEGGCHRLAVKYCSGQLAVWQLTDEAKPIELVLEILVPGGGRASPNRQLSCAFSFTTDGSFLCIGNSEGHVYVYRMTDGEEVGHVSSTDVKESHVRSCVVADDCRHLLAAMGHGFLFRVGVITVEQKAKEVSHRGVTKIGKRTVRRVLIVKGKSGGAGVKRGNVAKSIPSNPALLASNAPSNPSAFKIRKKQIPGRRSTSAHESTTRTPISLAQIPRTDIELLKRPDSLHLVNPQPPLAPKTP